ncbi:membrane fusion protein [Pelomonas aquatica]|uniref:Membrane fusion protein n=1 Tax=Pelomonas aquatica TaxID=431058 RepID=A0ABU1ZFT5_9BURK|nr:HlyD family efflux transporter periplasmic adaptor subunit [Pelomonas aquatica]MDR7299497.1 membrane fusion protein [Pelomonas aquatica]
MSELFRREALEAKQVAWLGEILLSRPLSLGLLVGGAAVIFAVFVGYIFLGEYTRKERITGHVQPSMGAARLYAPIVGRVLEKHVQEGQFVKQGQPLYVISIDRMTSRGGTQNGIAVQIAEKRLMLQSQIDAQKAIHAENERAQRNRSLDLQDQLQIVEREISLQKQRVALSEATVARFVELSELKFISSAQLSERQQERLDQLGRLAALERTRQNLTTEQRSLASTVRTAPFNAKVDLASLQRVVAEMDQEAYLNEAQRQIVIAAERDGWATAVLGEVGQTVTPEIPLMSVLPPGGQLEVHLYVPSRAIGFLQQGQQVKVRYDAFPYQKFGQHDGTVAAISNVALAPTELQLLGMAPEMLYRVKVKLKESTITAYGNKHPLREGMQLEADILLETRKLYEWLLEPLYSVAGKL